MYALDRVNFRMKNSHAGMSCHGRMPDSAHWTPGLLCLAASLILRLCGCSSSLCLPYLGGSSPGPECFTTYTNSNLGSRYYFGQAAAFQSPWISSTVARRLGIQSATDSRTLRPAAHIRHQDIVSHRMDPTPMLHGISDLLQTIKDNLRSPKLQIVK